MKLLKDIVTEMFAADKIHENPSVEQLMNIAKTSGNHARFIVHKDRIVAGGAGQKFYHYEMLPLEHRSPMDPHMYHQIRIDDSTPDYPHLRGNVDFWPSDNHFSVNVKSFSPYKGETTRGSWESTEHPILDKFRKKGVTVDKMRTTDLKPKDHSLLESLANDKVHHSGVTPELLKNLSRDSKHSQARFVVDRAGHAHAGDAMNFLHDKICPPEQQHTLGFIDHKGKDYNGVDQYDYSAWTWEGEHGSKLIDPPLNHPFLAKLQKAGIKNHFAKNKVDYWEDKKFSKFGIKEDISNKIFHDVSINQLKSIAKQSRVGLARFTIDMEDKMAGGDADNLYHMQLANDIHTKGFVGYEKGSDTYSYSAFRNPEKVDWTFKASHHPSLKFFEKRGIKRDNNVRTSDWTGKLQEGFAMDIIHQNPTIEQLKNIAKTSYYNEARFVVKDDRISTGADAYKYTHFQMLPPEAQELPHAHGDSHLAKYPHLRGSLINNGGENYKVSLNDYVFNNTVGHTSGWRPIDHPILRDFEKRGVQVVKRNAAKLDDLRLDRALVRRNVHEGYSLVYHTKLNQKIFKDTTMIKEVRDALLKIGYTFGKFAKIPEEAIKDIIFTGSNCNFNYSKYSDCDVHVIYDELMLGKGEYKEFLNDYFISKKALWTLTHDVSVKGYTVEVYAQAFGEHLAASGVYSLMDQKWLTMPVHDNYKFKRDPLLLKKIDDLKKTIDSMIETGVSVDEFRLMKEKLKTMRQAALSTGTEFAFDNLVFKGLRNSGVLKRMSEYLRTVRDKDLTLESNDPFDIPLEIVLSDRPVRHNIKVKRDLTEDSIRAILEQNGFEEYHENDQNL